MSEQLTKRDIERRAALIQDLREQIVFGSPKVPPMQMIKRVYTGEHLTPELVDRLTEGSLTCMWCTDPEGGDIIAAIELKLPGSATPEKLEQLMHVPPFMSGLRWATLSLPERLSAFPDTSPAHAVNDDIFEVMPQATRDYLAAWQSFVNDGTCWLLAGRFGHQAQELIRDGFLLWSRDLVFNAYGMEQPTRDSETPGAAGTPAFVEHIMGKRYLEWISAIR